MNKLPLNDPIRANQRKNVAARRVGINSKCACGESRPEALIAGTNPIICYECQKRQRGQSVIEAHHPFGKSNSPITIPIPANDHRAELSAPQMDWPKLVLQNPDGSPVLAMAGRVLGFIDTVLFLIKTGLQVAADFLVTLETFLTEKLGTKWWAGTPLEKFQPKGLCNAH